MGSEQKYEEKKEESSASEDEIMEQKAVDEADEFNEKIRMNRYMKEMESMKEELYGKERQIDRLQLENEELKNDTDRQIKELIAQNEALQYEQEKLKSDLQQYTISHIEKEVKNENGKLLNEMKKEN